MKPLYFSKSTYRFRITEQPAVKPIDTVAFTAAAPTEY